MLIKGGAVLSLDPEIGDLREGDVLIEHGRIVAASGIAPCFTADAVVAASGDMFEEPASRE
jgi:5-methylthioadenosine/S-adenosylhomocysteine deaminase